MLPCLTSLRARLDTAAVSVDVTRAEPLHAPPLAHLSSDPGAGFAPRWFRRRLVLLALVGLLVRVVVVLAVPTRPTSDSWSYFQRATNLLHHGRYEALPGLPDASYPPGYPLALAAAIAVVPAAHALGAARLLSCGLGFASILLIGLLGRRLFGATAGLLAAGLLAFYPRHVLQSAVLFSEHLFLPLLLLLLTILVTAWDRPVAWRLAALAGCVAGLLALVRPIGYPLGLLWVARVLAGRRHGRRILAEALLLIAMQHAVMLPWAIRNHVTLGRPSFLSSVGGVDLFIGNNPLASGGWMDWRPVLEEVEPAAKGARHGGFGVDDLARRAALRWIRENPAAAARLYVRKLGQILDPDGYLVTYAISGTDLWPPFGGTSALSAGHPAIALAPAIQSLLDWSYAAISALALAAIALAVFGGTLRRGRFGFSGAGMLPLVTAAYFPLVAAAFLSSSRFRWIAEDLLVLLAAQALVILLDRRRVPGGFDLS